MNVICVVAVIEEPDCTNGSERSLHDESPSRIEFSLNNVLILS
jgi:hypothetical protein